LNLLLLRIGKKQTEAPLFAPLLPPTITRPPAFTKERSRARTLNQTNFSVAYNININSSGSSLCVAVKENDEKAL
jgi:hypothetical protein